MNACSSLPYLCLQPSCAAEDIHLKLLVPYLAAGAIIGRGGEAVEAIKRQTGARLKMSKVNDFYPGTMERVCLITGTIDACLKLYDYITQKVSERPELSFCGPASPPLTPVTAAAATTCPTTTTPIPAIPISAGPTAAHGCLTNVIMAGGQTQFLPGDCQPGYTSSAGGGSGAYCCYQPQQLLYPYGVLCTDRRNQVKLLVPNKTAGIIIGRSGCFIKKIMEKSGTLVQVSQRPTEIKLPERCIVITGDIHGRRTVMSMILSKIAEDPESSSCPYFSYSLINEPVASAFPTGSPYAAGVVASSMVVDIPAENGNPNQGVVLCPHTSSSNSSISTVLDDMKLGNASTTANIYQQVIPNSFTPSSCCSVSAPAFFPVGAAAGGGHLLALPPGQSPAGHQLTTALGGALPRFSTGTWIAPHDMPVNEHSTAGAINTGVGASQLPLSLVQPVTSSTSPPHVTPPLVPVFGDVLLPRYATGQPPGAMNDRILNAIHVLQNYGRVVPVIESNGLIGASNTASPAVPSLGEPNCLLISPGDNLIYSYPPHLFSNPAAFPVMQPLGALQHPLHQQVYEELIPVVSSHLFNMQNTITVGGNSLANKFIENGVGMERQHHQIHRFYPNGLLPESIVQPTFLAGSDYPVTLASSVGHHLPVASLMPVPQTVTSSPIPPPAASDADITTVHTSTSNSNNVSLVDSSDRLSSPSVSLDSTCNSLCGAVFPSSPARSFPSAAPQQASAGSEVSAGVTNPGGLVSSSLRLEADASPTQNSMALGQPSRSSQNKSATIAMTTTISPINQATICQPQQSPSLDSPIRDNNSADQGLMLIGTLQQVHSALAKLQPNHCSQAIMDEMSGNSAGVEVAFNLTVPWRVDTIRPLELNPVLPEILKPSPGCPTTTTTMSCGTTKPNASVT